MFRPRGAHDKQNREETTVRLAQNSTLHNAPFSPPFLFTLGAQSQSLSQHR